MANIYDSLQPVKSSMFSRAGYSDATWELLFEFKSSGEIRSYAQVSPEVADEALSAESLGKWFNANIKGNSSWEFEVLGADPNAPPLVNVEKKADKPKAAKKPPVADMGISVADIQNVDPSYQPDERGINGLDACIGDEDHPLTTWPTYGGIDRSQTTIPLNKVEVLGSGKIEWDDKHNIAGISPFTEEDVFTGDVKVSAPTMRDLQNAHAKVEKQPDVLLFTTPPTDPESFDMKELAVQSTAEIMPKWTAPESAAEALELLSERETEINALIESCKQAGKAALAVKVTDADSRLKASDTLTGLVEQKDRAKELLEPFRVQLYEAYTYAQQKGKAAVDPIESAVTHVKKQMVAWDQEQERQRQAAIRKARDEAAAEEKRRQEAESQRLTLLELEDKLDQGDEAGAQALFEQPIQAPRQYVQPVYTPSAAPTIEGQSSSTRWKVDETPLESEEGYLDSVMALLRAVKDDKIEMRMAASYLKWDLVSLNKLAGALRGAFSVPGLTAAPVGNISVRRSKR